MLWLFLASKKLLNPYGYLPAITLWAMKFACQSRPATRQDRNRNACPNNVRHGRTRRTKSALIGWALDYYFRADDMQALPTCLGRGKKDPAAIWHNEKPGLTGM